MDPVKGEVEDAVDDLEDADEGEAHADAQEAAGCRDEGQGGDGLVTADLGVDGILDEHPQDQDVGLRVVRHEAHQARVGLGKLLIRAGVVQAEALGLVDPQNFLALGSVGGLENSFSARCLADERQLL